MKSIVLFFLLAFSTFGFSAEQPRQISEIPPRLKAAQERIENSHLELEDLRNSFPGPNRKSYSRIGSGSFLSNAGYVVAGIGLAAIMFGVLYYLDDEYNDLSIWLWIGGGIFFLGGWAMILFL